MKKILNWTHYRNHFPGEFIRVSTRRKAKLDKFDTRSLLVLLFYPIGRKKSSFPSRGTNPLYFSRNFPKGHTKKEGGVEERRKGAPLVFLVQATLKVLIFLLYLCPFRLFESLLYLFPTLSLSPFPPLFIHQTRFSRPLVLVYLLQPLVFRYFLVTSFIPRGILSCELSPSLPVYFFGVPLVYVSASLIILFKIFFKIDLSVSASALLLKASVILDVV